MTEHPHRPPGAEPGNEAFIRASGRGILITFHSVLRSVKLSPVENATFQMALDQLPVTVRRFD